MVGAKSERRRRWLRGPQRMMALVSCSVFRASDAFVQGPPSVQPWSGQAETTRVSASVWPSPSSQFRLMGHRGNDDHDTDSEENRGWGVGDDWYVTNRMRFLREMERLGQEYQDLSEAYNNGPAGNVPEAELPRRTPPASPSSPKHVNELVMQEELRRTEIIMAEKCAQNWKAQPISSRPVGYVPGGRKVQKVKLFNKRVAYGSDAGYIGLCATGDGKQIFGQQVHSALVTAVDYDGNWMLSAADDGMAVVYKETAQGVQVRHEMRHHTHRIIAAEILDHRLGVTASVDGKVVVFELSTGRKAEEITTSDTLLAASVCGGYIFAGLMSGTVEAYSIREKCPLAFRYRSQPCPIRSIKTYPTANSIKVITGGQDGLIRQFHVKSTQAKAAKLLGDRLCDDKLVLMCNTHVNHESTSVDQGFVLRGHRGPVVALTCDEDKVVSASEDGSVTVWDANRGSPRYSIRKHVDGDLVATVDFNERYLALDGTKGAVFVFDYSVSPPPRRPAPGTHGSGTSSGGKPRRGASGGRKGSTSPGGRRNQGIPPPPGLPPGLPNFPFVGGWNLGHGPIDFNAADMNGAGSKAEKPGEGKEQGGQQGGGDGAAGGEQEGG